MIHTQKSLESWAQRLIEEGNPLGENLLAYAKTWEQEKDTLSEVAVAMRDWIDAVPTDVQLPSMPGFDRDWADSVIAGIADFPATEIIHLCE